MVVWTANEFVSRPGGRPHWRRGREGRLGRSPGRWRQQDSVLHSLVSRDRLLRRHWPGPTNSENCHAIFPFYIRSRFLTAATCICGALQSRSRNERCAKDNGNHSAPSFAAGILRLNILCPI